MEQPINTPTLENYVLSLKRDLERTEKQIQSFEQSNDTINNLTSRVACGEMRICFIQKQVNVRILERILAKQQSDLCQKPSN